MNFIHGIVAVNRPDLLRRAVESVKPIWRHVFILDNSPGGIIGAEGWPVPVVRPSVPLSCAQSMNFLARLAKDRGCKAFGYQHNDAEAVGDGAGRFLKAVEDATASDQKWAAIFTNYDTLSANNLAAVDDVGEWDTAFPLPDYKIDVDWFYRARVRGWQIIRTDIQVNHLGSATVAADPLREIHKRLKEPWNEAYYREKWGGGTDEETRAEAWGDQLHAARERGWDKLEEVVAQP